MRLASLVFGLFLFAVAIVLTLESRLWPWEVLHQGIARHTPLSFGMARVAVGLVVLAVFVVFVGPVVEASIWLLARTPLAEPEPRLASQSREADAPP